MHLLVTGFILLFAALALISLGGLIVLFKGVFVVVAALILINLLFGD